MQMCEFYRKKYEIIEFFEGRWSWKFESEKIAENRYRTTFEWIDLFAKEENVTFTSKDPHQFFEILFPINRNFGAVSTLPDDGVESSIWFIEFDWERKEFTIGDKECIELRDYFHWTALLDRNCSSSSDIVNFVFFNTDPAVYRHCRVEIKNRQVVQIGTSFELPTEDFNCLDFCGDIVSGISESLDTVNRFDVRRRVLLDKINIYGLPSTVRCLWKYMYLRDCGCWTSYNQFFIWSSETEIVNDQERTYFKLHCVDLETGIAVPLSYDFPHRVTRICQSSEDGNLYVQSSECIERRDNQGGSRNPTFVDHLYRIPLNTPESLFFTAFKNIPKPLPPIIEKLAMQRRDLPLNAYKCE